MPSISEYSAELRRFKALPEDEQGEIPKPPKLGDVLDRFRLKNNQLLLGIAEDSDRPLPVTLNLNDPWQGLVYVTGDDKSGKSDFLHRLTDQVRWKRSNKIGFSVITTRPAEWDKIRNSPACYGVQRIAPGQLTSFLSAQNRWAENNRKQNHPSSRVILIQNLASCKEQLVYSGDLPLLQELFDHAALGRVSVVATHNLHARSSADELTEHPHTKVIGHMSNPTDAASQGLEPTQLSQALVPKVEFICQNPGQKPTQFWAPTIPLYNSLGY